jgi:hypothetical protein
LDVGTRDSMETGELDVRDPNRPGELALTENSADRAQPVSRDEPRSRSEVYAKTRQRVEGGWEPRLFEAPRAELSRFTPERAALPPVGLDAATDYVAQHRDARPLVIRVGI